MTDPLLIQLEEHEGFVPHAYKDSQGWWTIGIGRLVDQRRGGRISREEALYLLQNDVEDATGELDLRLSSWRDLSDIRQRVLLDMAFQLGVGGLMKFRSMRQRLNEKNYRMAAEQMRRSLWYTQTFNRAERLARMMETGHEVPLSEVP